MATCRGEDSQDRAENDEVKTLAVPDLLKASVQKRPRSNSPSIFAIKEERVRTCSESGNRRSSLITPMENKNLSAVRKLSSGNVKVSSLDSHNNNFLSVASHAGRSSHSDM